MRKAEGGREEEKKESDEMKAVKEGQTEKVKRLEALGTSVFSTLLKKY